MEVNEILLENGAKKRAIKIKKFDGKVKPKNGVKRRYLVIILISFGLFISFILRVSLSVAIVAMTEKTDRRDAEFDWDSKTKGLILSSFFYGYVSTQLLGGMLNSRIGGKKALGIGLGVASVLSICTPYVTRIDFRLLIVLRIIHGFIEGGGHPCIHSILANWAPPLERSKLLTLSYSGGFIGIVFGMTVSGLMSEYLGWTSVFYVFGALGLVWFVLWWIIVTDKPEDDPRISQSELDYIHKSLGKNIDHEKNKYSIPWKNILTSLPMWAIFIAHFSENWGFFTMLTQLPTFMSDVLNYKVERSGLFSALPYLAISISLPLSGVFADYLRSKKYLTTTQVRKIFNCSAFVAQAVFTVSTVFVKSNTAAIVCLVMSLALGGFAGSGFASNHLDIAPQHASIVMGLSNTISTIPGIISPILTGYIVKNKSEAEWTNVFLIAGGIQCFGALIYGIFASGEEQDWAKNQRKKKLIVSNNEVDQESRL